MCKFCKMHAQGYGKWYLNPKGFSEEFFYKLSLLDRILGREPRKVRDAKVVSESAWYPIRISKMMDEVNWSSLPFVGHLVRIYGNYVAIRSHAAQVVPLEDALKIIDLSHDHTLYPCMCKRLFKGQDEYKCLNYAPLTEINRKATRGWKEKRLSPEEAKEKLQEFDEKGFVHAVFWWCEMPQSICICNCDTKYCYAARPRTWYGIENAYRKSEYVSEVDIDKCIGCGECVKRCQFGAISLEKDERAHVDPKLCFGCGLCRMVCEQNAIKLTNRNTHPLARKIW
ncbi:MAG: 4Fe-4S binding protein [Candidatus Jordarchaeaceae archaeon]